VVTIDPDAGVSPTDPNANQTARNDVETALANWGRFNPVIDKEHADLVIIVRKRTGKLATGTISDPRQNSRVGGITPSDDGISIGARRPAPISTGGSSQPGSTPTESAHPQVEVGDTLDSFIVEDVDGYRWRYDAKDALHHHDVPAVDKFKNALEEAEKAAAANKTQPAQSPTPQMTTKPPASHP
jgi:hypothetical protein